MSAWHTGLKIEGLKKRSSIKVAMDAYDKGESEFFTSLSNYQKFEDARKFEIVYKGKSYPSKPILAYALVIEFGPKTSAFNVEGGKTKNPAFRFSGGRRTIRILERLKFTVRDKSKAIATKVDEIDEFSTGVKEGRPKLHLHLIRERNPRLKKEKIESVLNAGGKICCEACGFDFEETYGKWAGNQFIECHHTIPIHTMKKGAETMVNDLALLCANCHRIVHRPHLCSKDEPCLKIVDLKELIGTS